jgi:hypothetical protein
LLALTDKIFYKLQGKKKRREMDECLSSKGRGENFSINTFEKNLKNEINGIQ